MTWNIPRPAQPGEKFGLLTVTKVLPCRSGKGRRLCQCKCGGKKEVNTNDLMVGHTKSCGCLWHAKGQFRQFEIPRWGHRAVRRLFREMHRQNLTFEEVEAISGVAVDTMKGWKRGPTNSARRPSPKVDNLDAALQAVGLRLTVESMKVEEVL